MEDTAQLAKNDEPGYWMIYSRDKSYSEVISLMSQNGFEFMPNKIQYENKTEQIIKLNFFSDGRSIGIVGTNLDSKLIEKLDAIRKMEKLN